MGCSEKILIIFAVFTFCFGISPLCFSEDDVATALYQEGIKKYILEDFKGAIKDFESAYRLEPDNPKIKGMYINTLLKQGGIEYEKNNLKQSAEYYRRALELSGEDKELQKRLALIRQNIEEEKRLEEELLEVKEAELEAGEPEIVAIYPGAPSEVTPREEIEVARAQPEEVQLPFDIDEFVRQQNEENKRLLSELAKAQQQERERLVQRVEENQRILNENLKEQRHERQTYFRNVEESRKILSENIESQKEERQSFIASLINSRELLSESIEAQRQERRTLMDNVRDNQRMLTESIRAQSDERAYFLKNMMDVIQSQSEDRKLFSRSLMILVVGGIVIAIIIVLGFIMLVRKRISQIGSVYHEPQPSIDFRAGPMLDYDETKYITDEHYSDMVKAKRLRELEQEIQKGNRSWDTIQGYLSELNHEVKSEILSIVENKIKSGDTSGLNSAVEILLPFITDGDKDIGQKSKRLVRRIAGGEGKEADLGFLEPEEGEDPTDPLSIASLLNMATMADTKTGRLNHSIRVAEVASKIAEELKDTELDPSTVKKVGLAHDIGYLEISDAILKTEGELTERQFAIIKTHPERGLKLFQHVDLPQIFIDGIRSHHERLDGSGYPDGLKAEAIPRIAKVLAVADFFDAVTSTRPHRPPLTIESAFDMMEKLAGKIFDRELYEILVSLYKEETDGGS
jgi:putative nucleotidyltransferase with HDIG domain